MDSYRLHGTKYSFNDYFGWENYDSFPKSSGGTDILFLSHNPLTTRIYTAWHTKPESIHITSRQIPTYPLFQIIKSNM